jgi:sec-independent protein translocase protein TatA
MVGDILQPTHLLFVLVVALLVLGPKRLPEVGRTLGNGIRDFRSAINGESTESRDEIESQPWHSDPEPEEKHEFAHQGETTPESHEFAHQAPAASANVPETPQTVPPPAAPAPAAAPAVVARPKPTVLEEAEAVASHAWSAPAPALAAGLLHPTAVTECVTPGSGKFAVNARALAMATTVAAAAVGLLASLLGL